MCIDFDKPLDILRITHKHSNEDVVGKLPNFTEMTSTSTAKDSEIS